MVHPGLNLGQIGYQEDAGIKVKHGTLGYQEEVQALVICLLELQLLHFQKFSNKVHVIYRQLCLGSYV